MSINWTQWDIFLQSIGRWWKERRKKQSSRQSSIKLRKDSNPQKKRFHFSGLSSSHGQSINCFVIIQRQETVYGEKKNLTGLVRSARRNNNKQDEPLRTENYADRLPSGGSVVPWTRPESRRNSKSSSGGRWRAILGREDLGLGWSFHGTKKRRKGGCRRCAGRTLPCSSAIPPLVPLQLGLGSEGQKGRWMNDWRTRAPFEERNGAAKVAGSLWFCGF